GTRGQPPRARGARALRRRDRDRRSRERRGAARARRRDLPAARSAGRRRRGSDAPHARAARGVSRPASRPGSRAGELSAAGRESWLDRADRIGRRIENALLVVGFSALTLLAGAQIVLRNVFSVGIVWEIGRAHV